MTSAAKFNRAICATAEHVNQHYANQDAQMRALAFVSFLRGWLGGGGIASAKALKALDQVLDRQAGSAEPTAAEQPGVTC